MRERHESLEAFVWWRKNRGQQLERYSSKMDMAQSAFLNAWGRSREVMETSLTKERDEARAIVKELVEYIELTTEIADGSFASGLLVKAKQIH